MSATLVLVRCCRTGPNRTRHARRERLRPRMTAGLAHARCGRQVSDETRQPQGPRDSWRSAGTWGNYVSKIRILGKWRSSGAFGEHPGGVLRLLSVAPGPPGHTRKPRRGRNPEIVEKPIENARFCPDCRVGGAIYLRWHAAGTHDQMETKTVRFGLSCTAFCTRAGPCCVASRRSEDPLRKDTCLWQARNGPSDSKRPRLGLRAIRRATSEVNLSTWLPDLRDGR